VASGCALLWIWRISWPQDPEGTERLAAGLRTFHALAHRMEPVGEFGGVLWINDSKATNPHAASASLATFSNVVWIAGGLSKGVSYDDLIREHVQRLKAVVLIGSDTSALSQALQRHAPDVPVIIPGAGETEEVQTAAAAGAVHAGSSGETVMASAVASAAQLAESGDTVLMAPAAASMDQFSSYAHRGDTFIEAVRELVEGQAQTGEE
jgi:UDP-N-acetylmuramoylalanine--D-glutamate ligase